MKTISKQCKTLKQAERYQNRLYEKYQRVRLVKFPWFTEKGSYVWEVK
jgi:hypothetical protein